MSVPSLRIVHIAQYQAPIIDSMVRALREMGHHVHEIDVRKRHGLISNPLRRKGGNGPVWVHLGPIRAEITEFRPHVILCNGGGLVFRRKAIRILQRMCPVVGITLSDPDVFPTMSPYAGRFTWMTTNSLASYRRYRRRGLLNVIYMPFGIDRQYLRKVGPVERYLADVAVIGHAWADRIRVVRRIRKYCKIRLYGRGWPFNSPGPVYGEDWLKAAHSAKLLLNFPRTRKGHTNVKVGIFEGAATGTPVLTRYFSEMRRHFRYGREIIGYQNVGDLIQKIKYYLANPAAAAAIGQAARLRILREHTWQARFEDLFSRIFQRRSG